MQLMNHYTPTEKSNSEVVLLLSVSLWYCKRLTWRSSQAWATAATHIWLHVMHATFKPFVLPLTVKLFCNVYLRAARTGKHPDSYICSEHKCATAKDLYE